MKNRKKHRRILFLMIASQLLLTGFVMQWLFSQYRGEKDTLIKELTGFYIESRDETLDTLLFRSYVNPVLTENKIIVMDQMTTLKDSSMAGTTFLRESTGKNESVKRYNKNEIITLNIQHGSDSAFTSPDSLKHRGLSEDMLLRSVRLIVAHSGDTVNSKNRIIKSFTLDLDTSMFIKYFHNRLMGTGMNFQVDWEGNKSEPVNEKGKQILYIKSGLSSALPQAAVARYRGYLLGRILPQIIFGFVLVLLTGLAFLLSYRSISNYIIMNSLRNEFVSNITHELKTPVATLRVALESLSKYNLRNEPQVMDEYLELASIETRRLEELINRVLDHSLLDENNHPLNLVMTDINKLIQEVAGIMQKRIESEGRIEFRSEEEDILIKCDPLYIKGVLINLVDNSIKYCDREPEIIIVSSWRKGYAMIEVKDNGPGIPEEYLNKVFEKFFRLPSDNIHNVKGYGLGLSFASQVMKHHKGSIEVKNLEQGCSFIIKIPVV